MKLKDLLQKIETDNRIMLINSHGEEFYPAYSQLDRYGECFVVDIIARDKEVISINIKQEE